MTWNEFLGEFNATYYDTVGLRPQQNEFNNLKQGDMTIIEACRKFDRLGGRLIEGDGILFTMGIFYVRVGKKINGFVMSA